MKAVFELDYQLEFLYSPILVFPWSAIVCLFANETSSEFEQ